MWSSGTWNMGLIGLRSFQGTIDPSTKFSWWGLSLRPRNARKADHNAGVRWWCSSLQKCEWLILALSPSLRGSRCAFRRLVLSGLGGDHSLERGQWSLDSFHVFSNAGKSGCDGCCGLGFTQNLSNGGSARKVARRVCTVDFWSGLEAKRALMPNDTELSTPAILLGGDRYVGGLWFRGHGVGMSERSPSHLG